MSALQCPYCAGQGEHHALCPLPVVQANPNRQDERTHEIAISDWVDALSVRLQEHPEANRQDALSQSMGLILNWGIRQGRAQAERAVAA